MWNLKYGTMNHLQSRNRLSETRLVFAKGVGTEREWDGWGVWGL